MPVRSLRFLLFALCLGAPLAALSGTAPPDRAALTASLQKIVDDHLARNVSIEGITAISASVSLAATFYLSGPYPNSVLSRDGYFREKDPVISIAVNSTVGQKDNVGLALIAITRR